MTPTSLHLPIRRLALWGLASLLLAAGAPASATAHCAAGTVLAFVAHADDDLLFMNPDQQASIARDQCLHTVYLTAGDRGEGLPYTRARERGLMAAYAEMAGAANRWATDSLDVAGHHLVRHTLRAHPEVQLIMLRIPDPWLGRGWGSLTPLSRLESVAGTQVRAYAPYPERYTRAALVDLLAGLIRAQQPSVIRLMDASIAIPYTQLCWRCVGHDHPDHIASARLVIDAMRQAPGPYRAQAYLGYPSQERPANLRATQKALKTGTFLHYMANDPRYCRPQAPCSRPKGPEAAWVWRQYPIPASKPPR
ncbi:PIG-L family deacetylase [Castellaniella caeni]|uniref:PIG-L family deacetylase n=1 Tax=Castellaniella caeni TaxID=266123 RepID=UPI000C9EEB43|nr:PIG-L family deacetylase [Castellaniella caeni]